MISFSRTKLEQYLACQRRFQLRYVDVQPWPKAPVNEVARDAMDRGELFHQLVAQHYLGLPVSIGPSDLQPPVRDWWHRFQHHGPTIPSNWLVLPELTLTTPIGNHQLLGRLDLLVADSTSEVAQIHLYDWKTGHPQGESTLMHDWQTRLYLALVVEGATGLGISTVSPEEVQLTYWYARDPQQSVTITYSREWHERNWNEIEYVVGTIDGRLGTDEHEIWPLTEDLTECSGCAYQNLCGRFDVDRIVAELLSERRPNEDDLQPGRSWQEIAEMEPLGT